MLPRPPVARYTGRNGTMRALTPRRLAHTGKASLLALLCRPSIPSPTTSWARTSPSHPRRCVRPGVATQASSWDRELAAPQRRNGFVILRAARSPPAASHPASRKTSQLDDAVAFGYMWRDLTWVGLPPPDKATSQTHGPRLRGDDSGESLLHIFGSGDERRLVNGGANLNSSSSLLPGAKLIEFDVWLESAGERKTARSDGIEVDGGRAG